MTHRNPNSTAGGTFEVRTLSLVSEPTSELRSPSIFPPMEILSKKNSISADRWRNHQDPVYESSYPQQFHQPRGRSMKSAVGVDGYHQRLDFNPDRWRPRHDPLYEPVTPRRFCRSSNCEQNFEDELGGREQFLQYCNRSTRYDHFDAQSYITEVQALFSEFRTGISDIITSSFNSSPPLSYFACINEISWRDEEDYSNKIPGRRKHVEYNNRACEKDDQMCATDGFHIINQQLLGDQQVFDEMSHRGANCDDIIRGLSGDCGGAFMDLSCLEVDEKSPKLIAKANIDMNSQFLASQDDYVIIEIESNDIDEETEIDNSEKKLEDKFSENNEEVGEYIEDQEHEVGCDEEHQVLELENNEEEEEIVVIEKETKGIDVETDVVLEGREEEDKHEEKQLLQSAICDLNFMPALEIIKIPEDFDPEHFHFLTSGLETGKEFSMDFGLPVDRNTNGVDEEDQEVEVDVPSQFLSAHRVSDNMSTEGFWNLKEQDLVDDESGLGSQDDQAPAEVYALIDSSPRQLTDMQKFIDHEPNGVFHVLHLIRREIEGLMFSVVVMEEMLRNWKKRWKQEYSLRIVVFDLEVKVKFSKRESESAILFSHQGIFSVEMVSKGFGIDMRLLRKGNSCSRSWKLGVVHASTSSVADLDQVPSNSFTSDSQKKSNETALILVRHGESLRNKKNLFTGCVVVPLNQKGVEEAIEAGKRISNITVDMIYTSALICAQKTAMLAMTQHRHKKHFVYDPGGNEVICMVYIWEQYGVHWGSTWVGLHMQIFKPRRKFQGLNQISFVKLVSCWVSSIRYGMLYDSQACQHQFPTSIFSSKIQGDSNAKGVVLSIILPTFLMILLMEELVVGLMEKGAENVVFDPGGAVHALSCGSYKYQVMSFHPQQFLKIEHFQLSILQFLAYKDDFTRRACYHFMDDEYDSDISLVSMLDSVSTKEIWDQCSDLRGCHITASMVLCL